MCNERYEDVLISVTSKRRYNNVVLNKEKRQISRTIPKKRKRIASTTLGQHEGLEQKLEQDYLSKIKSLDPEDKANMKEYVMDELFVGNNGNKFHKMSRICLLYTSPSPRDQRGSRMPSSA